MGQDQSVLAATFSHNSPPGSTATVQKLRPRILVPKEQAKLQVFQKELVQTLSIRQSGQRDQPPVAGLPSLPVGEDETREGLLRSVALSNLPRLLLAAEQQLANRLRDRLKPHMPLPLPLVTLRSGARTRTRTVRGRSRDWRSAIRPAIVTTPLHPAPKILRQASPSATHNNSELTKTARRFSQITSRLEADSERPDVEWRSQILLKKSMLYQE
ncbi:unnamed protein product [Protopolystoma xenopodis]|uniref:Uncharacterized protein n=1 Tax=Protopolystoma xenopodis TaxID=117903 RepID=A0A448WY79_9PLAT|nr:unnamed protein product [Protopolystoma xenopodis]